VTRSHPPFCPAPEKPTSANFCSEGGAHVLAGRIKAAWKACGHDVRVIVEPAKGFLQTDKTAVWTVRMPDLVNGLPWRGGA
jgi:hypothetical protein